MANEKKYASLSALQIFLDNLKNVFATKTDVNTELTKKADSSHTHSINDTANLQDFLDGKVSTSRTINGKALSTNITLSASDVDAATSSHNHDDRYCMANSNISASRLVCYSETIHGTLESGTSFNMHYIENTNKEKWVNGIPIVRSVSWEIDTDDDGGEDDYACAQDVIYTVSECKGCNELSIRVQRPTGTATSKTVEYELQLDVIGF